MRKYPFTAYALTPFGEIKKVVIVRQGRGASAHDAYFSDTGDRYHTSSLYDTQKAAISKGRERIAQERERLELVEANLDKAEDSARSEKNEKDIPPVGAECKCTFDGCEDEDGTVLGRWGEGDRLRVISHEVMQGIVVPVFWNLKREAASTLREDCYTVLHSDKAEENLK